MPGLGSSPQPKPEPRARVKGRAQRQARTVVNSVRSQCVARDGSCRIGQATQRFQQFGACDGASQWAHLGDSKRFKTRGQAPEIRHTTAGSLMLCARHHDGYDGRQPQRITIVAQTDRGADGPLTYAVDREQVVEVERER